jgi:3'(2'), 5'-bisphosphate nucleotidase
MMLSGVAALPSVTRLLEEITTLVSRAAAAILAIDIDHVAKRLKSDLSPVTAADEVAQAVILEGLPHVLPGIPVISEEASEQWPALEPGSPFVLVDPLDGTREFLAGRSEYTVNVALVSGGVPVLGCIAAPALGAVWRGAAGVGAQRLDLPAGAEASACCSRRSIRTRQLPARGARAAVSRSHFEKRSDKFLRRFPEAERVFCGSSLKFCYIAEGDIDLYPRLAPTHEWDIAAGDGVVRAAGGIVVTEYGAPLTYGHSADAFRVSGFVAYGDPAAVREAVAEK